MGLSSELIASFVKVMNHKETPKDKVFTYGTIVVDGYDYYVRLDGSNLLTPIETVTNLAEGQRVVVEIKDHTALVSGNLTAPAATAVDLGLLSEDLTTRTNSYTNEETIMVDRNIQNDVIFTSEFEMRKPSNVLALIEIDLNAAASENIDKGICIIDDVNVILSYLLNGESIENLDPRETYQDGDHILTAFCNLGILQKGFHEFSICMNVGGGLVRIDPYHLNIVLLSQGLGENERYGEFDILAFDYFDMELMRFVFPISLVNGDTIKFIYDNFNADTPWTLNVDQNEFSRMTKLGGAKQTVFYLSDYENKDHFRFYLDVLNLDRAEEVCTDSDFLSSKFCLPKREIAVIGDSPSIHSSRYLYVGCLTDVKKQDGTSLTGEHFYQYILPGYQTKPFCYLNNSDEDVNLFVIPIMSDSHCTCVFNSVRPTYISFDKNGDVYTHTPIVTEWNTCDFPIEQSHSMSYGFYIFVKAFYQQNKTVGNDLINALEKVKVELATYQGGYIPIKTFITGDDQNEQKIGYNPVDDYIYCHYTREDVMNAHPEHSEYARLYVRLTLYFKDIYDEITYPSAGSVGYNAEACWLLPLNTSKYLSVDEYRPLTVHFYKDQKMKYSLIAKSEEGDGE